MIEKEREGKLQSQCVSYFKIILKYIRILWNNKDQINETNLINETIAPLVTKQLFV